MLKKFIWQPIQMICIAIALLAALCACSLTKPSASFATSTPSLDVPLSTTLPKPMAKSRYGNPDRYAVSGQQYHVLPTAKGYCKVGYASWYGTKFHGRCTSSREPYDMFRLTAASRILPIPTYVEVTNLENGHSIVVKVNDRGPFKSDRIIDLSYLAAAKLGFADKGTAKVQVKALDLDELNNDQISQSNMLANTENSTEVVQINPKKLASHSNAAAIKLQRYLQLGAFSHPTNAVRLKDQLAQYTKASIRIKTGTLNNQTIYRVQIGPFHDASESDDIQQTLLQHGFNKVITLFS
jgi:rare lipoprotein A